jgi:hypothetical protein
MNKYTVIMELNGVQYKQQIIGAYTRYDAAIKAAGLGVVNAVFIVQEYFPRPTRFVVTQSLGLTEESTT